MNTQTSKRTSKNALRIAKAEVRLITGFDPSSKKRIRRRGTTAFPRDSFTKMTTEQLCRDLARHFELLPPLPSKESRERH